jgi:hypothetical protein
VFEGVKSTVGESGIIVGQGFPHAGHEQFGRLAAADDHFQCAPVAALAAVEIHLVSAGFFERAVADIRHDSNDRGAAIDGELATQGVFTRPKGAGEVLVNDDGLLPRWVEALVEEMPGYQRDLHHFQIIGIHQARVGDGIFSIRILAANLARPPSAIATQRKSVAETDRFHPRKRGDPPGHAAEVKGHILTAFERSGGIDAPGHGVLRLESEVDLQDGIEAANEQAGSHQ